MKRIFLSVIVLAVGFVACTTSERTNKHEVILEGYMLDISETGDTLHVLKLNDNVTGVKYMATLKEYYDTLAKPENVGRVYDFRDLIPQHEYCPL